MEYITKWVTNIIIIVLITTFLGMFLPESNLRKYLRVVMGFFIISIFISPISLILNGDLEIKSSIIPENRMELKWKEIEENGKNISENNDEIIDNYYSEKLSTRIKSIVNLDFPESETEILTEIKNKYRIERINIDIYDSNRVKAVKIKEVNLDEEYKKKEISRETREKLINCKNSICDILQLSPSVVNIKYHSGGELIAVY